MGGWRRRSRRYPGNGPDPHAVALLSAVLAVAGQGRGVCLWLRPPCCCLSSDALHEESGVSAGATALGVGGGAWGMGGRPRGAGAGAGTRLAALAEAESGAAGQRAEGTVLCPMLSARDVSLTQHQHGAARCPAGRALCVSPPCGELRPSLPGSPAAPAAPHVRVQPPALGTHGQTPACLRGGALPRPRPPPGPASGAAAPPSLLGPRRPRPSSRGSERHQPFQGKPRKRDPLCPPRKAQRCRCPGHIPEGEGGPGAPVLAWLLGRVGTPALLRSGGVAIPHRTDLGSWGHWTL